MRPHPSLLAIVALVLAARSAFAGIPAGYQGRPFEDAMHQTGPANIPGIVQCALYDLGGEGVAYHDTTPANEGSGVLNRQTSPYNHERIHACDYIWHFREHEGVDLSYVKDWADLNHPNPVSPPINLHYIGWAEDGEWTNYTVNVTQPGTYAVFALYSFQKTQVSFDLNGSPAARCEVPRATASWHTWDFGRIGTLTFPEAGRQLLTFRYGRGNNWAFFVFIPVSSP